MNVLKPVEARLPTGEWVHYIVWFICVPSAGQFQSSGMNVANVKPLLVHLPVWQQAVSRQRGPAPALAAARYLPEARALEQEDGAVGVGEVGSVDVAIWMVSSLHRRENVSDGFGEASCQAAGFHAECKHLFGQKLV